MATTATAERIDDSGQGVFMLLLIVCAGFFAIGFSITVFGLTSKFLPDVTTQLEIVVTGLLGMLLGLGGGYRLLN